MYKFNMEKILNKTNEDLTAAGIPKVYIEELIQKDNFTFCKVCAEGATVYLEGEGFAKRNPKDRPNPGLGRKLAFSRAVSAYTTLYKSTKRAVENVKRTISEKESILV